MAERLTTITICIPTDDRKSVRETFDIKVPSTWDEEIQEWLLTPEACRQIDIAKAKRMLELGMEVPERIRKELCSS